MQSPHSHASSADQGRAQHLQDGKSFRQPSYPRLRSLMRSYRKWRFMRCPNLTRISFKTFNDMNWHTVARILNVRSSMAYNRSTVALVPHRYMTRRENGQGLRKGEEGRVAVCTGLHTESSLIGFSWTEVGIWILQCDWFELDYAGERACCML